LKKMNRFDEAFEEVQRLRREYPKSILSIVE
jgi:hypothetical protein